MDRRPPPEPTQKSHFFKAPSPPPLPATAHAGKTSWVKWWAVGCALGGALHVSAHTHAHTHTYAGRQDTHTERRIHTHPRGASIHTHPRGANRCTSSLPTHPPLAWGHVDGAAMVAAPELGHHRAHYGPCSQRGAAWHQARLRDHAQQVRIEQRVLEKHESTHFYTFTCKARVHPLCAHTRSAALLSPSMT